MCLDSRILEGERERTYMGKGKELKGTHLPSPFNKLDVFG